MSEINLRRLAWLLNRADKAKVRIAAERDRLRDIIGELEAIADGMDDPDDSVSSALRELNHAADRMSEYL